MKQKIFTIGEALYDIIFKNEKPVSGCPGGSMLNTSVSLGRLKAPVHIISELGEDATGNIILNFLKTNGVKTDLIIKYKNGQTSLAMAVLDDVNNATYAFYKNYPTERTLLKKLPLVNENDIILFGSSYSLQKEIREPLYSFLHKAKSTGAVLIYDPNIRPSVIKENSNFKLYFKQNIAIADIIRCSSEDLIYSLGKNDLLYFYSSFLRKKQILICTSGKEKINLITNKINIQYTVPKIKPISTIGAGDNFNAGIIYELNKMGTKLNIKNLNEHDWDKIVNTAIKFAIQVCSSKENYLSDNFVKKHQSENL